MSNYQHNNKDYRLNDLHQAMQYRDDGSPEVRVNIGSGIDISGTVNIPGNITVSNTTSNPVISHITKIGTSGNLTVPYMPINGTVDLSETTLTNLENVNFNVASLPEISGTVNLSTSTLNALEVITVKQGTVPWEVNGNVNIDNEITVNFEDTQSDAFGRLRVSNPFTLFDSSLRYTDDTNKWNTKLTGNATAVHSVNESSMLLSVTSNGDQVIRETKCVFSYQPGKSLLILNTFVMAPAQTGLRQRVGYFGSQNGVYLELDNLNLNLVIRKYTSGSVDDTTEKINQTNWNYDKLDGTGPSGLTLNLTKSQIFWSDIEWLGVGSVRCGFVINGKFIPCHIFHHANSFDRVYMTTATLPCRYEITSTGASATLKQICSSVISEGGYVNRSITRAIGTSLSGKNLSNIVYTPLVCIRIKSSQIDSVVVPTKFDLYGLQQTAYSYRVIINPTLTGAVWTSTSADSAVEYDISATALTGGIVVDQGIFIGSNKGGSASVSSTDVDFSQQLGRTIDGVSDIWCIAAISTSVNDDAVASVSWQEHV